MQQGKWTGKLGAALPSLDKYIAIYKDLHQYPELPCQESRTAAIVAHHLRSLEYHVQTNIAGHGVVGILFNGAGKTVLLRSGLDAFPMQEDTGLPYVSQVRQSRRGRHDQARHAWFRSRHEHCRPAGHRRPANETRLSLVWYGRMSIPAERGAVPRRPSYDRRRALQHDTTSRHHTGPACLI